MKRKKRKKRREEGNKRKGDGREERGGGGKSLREEGGSKRERGMLGGVTTPRRQERYVAIDNYVAVSGPLCRYSCSDPLYQCRSLKSVRCIITVGQQILFSPTNCDFLSDKEKKMKIQKMIKSRYNVSFSFSNN